MKPYRVLLVDDHPRIRELYRLALMDERRLEVVGEAGDGEEALVRADETPPDVVVLDLSMPKRDGLQALQDLKQAHPRVRVLVLSGFNRERIEGLVLEMGANAYLEKGVTITELAGHVLQAAEQPPRAPTRAYTTSEFERRLEGLV